MKKISPLSVFGVVTLSLSCAAILLTSCGAKKDVSGVLRFRLQTDPPSFDWNKATDNVSREVIQNYQVGLVRFNKDTKVEPSLAESWTLSKDAKTYTFTLRQGLKWSDGSALVAQDFADGWERLLNPATAAEYAYYLFDVVGAEDYNKGTIKDFSKVLIKATDERTLVVTLKKPIAYWVQLCAWMVTFPIKKENIIKHGDRWTDVKNIVTNGPYILKTIERDSKVVLERNPLYYEASELKNMIPQVEYRIVKDDATAVTLFKRGEFDIVRDLPPVQIKSLSAMKEFNKAAFLRGYYLGFNVNDPTVKSIPLRQAIAHAIDRTQLETILGSVIAASSSWITPGLLGYNAERGLKFDVEKAKKLFATVNPKPTSLEFWYDTKEMNKLVAENIQSQLQKNLGLTVNLSNHEWKVYIKQLRAKSPAIFRLGWGADYPDPDTFMNLFTCSSGQNNGNYCNKRYDELISKSAASTNDSERVKFYDEAQKILLEEEAGIIPLFTQTNLHLVSQRVEGFYVDLLGDMAIKDFRLK